MFDYMASAYMDPGYRAEETVSRAADRAQTSGAPVKDRVTAAAVKAADGSKIAPNSNEGIFKNITFSKTGYFWWKTSDGAMAEAKKQFIQIANSTNPEGALTKAALNIRALNNGSTPVNIKVLTSLSPGDYNAKVVSGILEVKYNPNYFGRFDGVSHDGASILSHELAGHGPQKTVDIGDWREMDRRRGRPYTLREMEFDAVRV
jgi:hypothetical protein